MASGKKKRKKAAMDKKDALGPQAAPARQRDGDRRRRLGPLAREALKRKRQIQEWTIDREDPPLPPTE